MIQSTIWHNLIFRVCYAKKNPVTGSSLPVCCSSTSVVVLLLFIYLFIYLFILLYFYYLFFVNLLILIGTKMVLF